MTNAPKPPTLEDAAEMCASMFAQLQGCEKAHDEVVNNYEAALDELETVNAELGQARADRARLLASYNRAILDLTHLYESLGREGWEDGMTENEARTRAHLTLCEYYGDPYPRADRELPPEYLRQSGGAE